MRGGSWTIVAIALTAVAQSGEAQRTRAGFSVGATFLDFGDRWGGGSGGLSAQASVHRALGGAGAEVLALAILPFGVAAAIADCVPDAPCVQTESPNAMLGGVASIALGRGSSGWQTSAGLGGLAAAGMKGPGSRSSLVGSLALDWAPVRPGVGLTFGIRALGLASTIAELRYVVLPTIGITF